MSPILTFSPWPGEVPATQTAESLVRRVKRADGEWGMGGSST
jgi:hypothetical protein